MENMNPFDIIVLAILVLCAFWGGMRGVIAQIASIASWVFSWYIAARYYTIVGNLISSSDSSRTPIAIVITFALSVILLSVAFRFIKKVLHSVGLKEFDRQMGALLGIMKGGLLCVLITFFGVVMSDRTREIVNNSKSGPFLVSVISRLQSHFPDSELKKIFQNVVEENYENELSENSIKTYVDDLKGYLVKQVLTSDAAEIVKEADTNEETVSQNASSSLFRSLLSSIRYLNRDIKNTNDANVASEEPERPTGEGELRKSGYYDVNNELEVGLNSSYRTSSLKSYPSNDNSNFYSGPAYDRSQMANTAFRNDNNLSYDGMEAQNRNAEMNSFPPYDNADNAETVDFGKYAPIYVDAKTESYASVYNSSGENTNAPNDDFNSLDLSSGGAEFGIRTDRSLNTNRGLRSTTRRRGSGRTASSERLGSYSYSSNY